MPITIQLDHLAVVTGGAPPVPGARSQTASPSNTNNLGAWGLPSASDIMNAKPADNRVISPQRSQFPSRDMAVTSPQDDSWMQRIPGMFGQLGM